MAGSTANVQGCEAPGPAEQRTNWRSTKPLPFRACRQKADTPASGLRRNPRSAPPAIGIMLSHTWPGAPEAAAAGLRAVTLT